MKQPTDADMSAAEMREAMLRIAQAGFDAVDAGDRRGGIERMIELLADHLAVEIGADKAAHSLSSILMNRTDRWCAPLAALDLIRAKGGAHG